MSDAHHTTQGETMSGTTSSTPTSATATDATATATDATAPASPATVVAISRARKSRATRSAQATQATRPTATSATSATGRSTTGDNGVKTASQVRRELAAQPVKIETPATARKTAGEPTATDVKRLVASALVKAGADLAVNWDRMVSKTGKTDPLRKVSADQAMILINKYLSYVGTATWDPRLPAREHPGGRGKTA